MKFFLYLLFALLLNSCGGTTTSTYKDPERYESSYIDIMKKSALRDLDYHAVVHASSSYEAPYVYSATSFEKAKTNGLNDCGRKYSNCFVYKLRYLAHDPHTGFIYNENTKKIVKKKLSTTKKKSTEKKNPKKKLTMKQIMEEIYIDRDLNNLDEIEGIWVRWVGEEKKGRLYIIIRSDDYLYEEIVFSHPVEKFIGKTSTKLIKKNNENTYQTKATWLNDGKESERNGTIKIIDKFRLKFETSRHCYSDEKKCLESQSFYKEKHWPSKTYSDEANLSKEETNALKELLD